MYLLVIEFMVCAFVFIKLILSGNLIKHLNLPLKFEKKTTCIGKSQRILK